MSTGTIPDFRTKANNKDNENFERPPVGIHPGILISLIDLGTHESDYKGQKGERHKIHLTWELTAEADSKGQNFLIGQDFTWSLHKKAGLRPLVDGFRGKALGDEEEYDLAEMLGKPCMLTIGEGISGSGKKFIEVTALSPPMRGLTVPPANHELYAFLLDMINSALDPIEIPDWVPPIYGRKVIDEIKASKEYGKLPNF